MFAGGLFTQIRQPGKPAGQGEAVRTYIAAFNQTTGAPTTFAPVLNGPVYSIATSPDGKWVVIGGDFTTVNGIKRSKIAMFSVVTGKMVSAWDPVVSATGSRRWPSTATASSSAARSATIDGAVRNRLGAVRLIQGDLLPWNPNADERRVRDRRVRQRHPGLRRWPVQHDQRQGPLLAGDAEQHHRRGATRCPAAAAIPKPTATCTTRVKDIDTLGDNVYVSNGGDGGGCYDGVLAAQTSPPANCSGRTSAWARPRRSRRSATGSTRARTRTTAAPDGAFADGTGTHYLLVESAINGKIGPWFPNTDANPNSTTKVGPLAMAGTATDLWVGGDFLHVNGHAQQGLTRFTNTPGGAAPAVPKAPLVTVRRPDQVHGEVLRRVRPGQHRADLQRVPGIDQRRFEQVQHVLLAAAEVLHRDRPGMKRGSTYRYHIEVHDGRNIMKGPSVSVKIP